MRQVPEAGSEQDGTPQEGACSWQMKQQEQPCWDGYEGEAACADLYCPDFTLEHAQVVVGLGVVGRSCNGSLQHLQGVLGAALRCEDDGQVVQALREVGPQLQRRLVACEGGCAAQASRSASTQLCSRQHSPGLKYPHVSDTRCQRSVLQLESRMAACTHAA